MRVYFHIKEEHLPVKTLIYSMSAVNFTLSELDFVDIEIETDVYYNSEDLQVVIGNTRLLVTEAPERNGNYYYKIEPTFMRSILPGKGESHFSDRIQTKSEWRRFSRLFINEIGLSKVYFRYTDEDIHVANIIVETNKISTENYELVTLYLISVGYFDSNILYKAVIEGGQNDIKNSLLETLRELVKKLKIWKRNLPAFRVNPIFRYNSRLDVVEYTDTVPLDNESLDWLSNNLEVFQKVNPFSSSVDIVLDNNWLKIDQTLVKQIETTMDTYENRIIHGFLSNLNRILIELSKEVSSNSPRTRIRNFRDFLIQCFNKLILASLCESLGLIKEIKRFVDSELPVLYPLYKLPERVQGFLQKNHYRDVLDLINYSRRLFNINLDLSKFTLEVESFDKLFEVYCFHLLKDTISNHYGISEWTTTQSIDASNKIAGEYRMIINNNLTVALYYEKMPPGFVQLSRSPFPYNPDFFVEVRWGGRRCFIIMDAKYKNYNSGKKLVDDQSRLTLNYLHKIGITTDSNSEVLGLFTISLSSQNTNRIVTIFKNEFSLTHNVNSAVTPQIGNIELAPKSLNLLSNPFVTIISFLQDKVGFNLAVDPKI